MEDKIDIAQYDQCSMRERSLSTRCSCSECDSLLCFTKRRLPNTCTCSDCKQLKSCIYNASQFKTKKRYSDQINEVYLNRSKYAKAPERDRAVLTKSEMNFDLDRKNVIAANAPNPKSLDEYLTLLVPETKSKRNQKIKPESLKKYIDIISGKDTSKDETLNIYMKNFKEAKTLERIPNTGFVDKIKIKAENTTCKGTCKKCRQRKYTQIQSLLLSPPIIKLNTRIPLSTEIMDFSHSGSSTSNVSKVSEISANDTKNFKYDFFNYDIFKRLKDVYKACSCKVCECIPTKILNSDTCNCKPCDCLECTRYKNTLDTKRKSKNINTKCICKKYLKSYLSKSKNCSCKPCQCTECKKVIPQIQVFRGELHQNPPCHCLPCKCTDCLRGYGAASKDLVHEVSTTTSRHSHCPCEMCSNDTCEEGPESCKCDKRNIFRKPFEIIRHDYDIRTTTIINDICHYSNAVKEPDKQNMVTMLATIPHKYRRSKSSRICSCDECECITCVCQKDVIDTIKSSRLFPCDKNISKANIGNNCNCKPCQCYLCNQDKITNIKQNYSDRGSSLIDCRCKECDCIGDCDIDKKNYGHSLKSSSYKHNFADYTHATMLGAWPIKKGDILTPSAHQTKIKKQMSKTKFVTNSVSKTMSLNKLLCTNLKTLQKPVDTHSNSKEPYPNVTIPRSLVQLREVNKSKESNFGKNMESDLKKYRTNDVLKCDVYIQSQASKDNIPVLIKKLVNSKSQINISSNALGPDYPMYLTLLPNSTVKTCITDVLQYYIDNEIKLVISPNYSASEYSGQTASMTEFNNRNTHDNIYETKVSNHKFSKNTRIWKNPGKIITTSDAKHHEIQQREELFESFHMTNNSNKKHIMPHACNCYSCFNISNKKSTNSVNNEHLLLESVNSSCTNFDDIVNTLSIKADHERVQKTLKDAQEFYLHLVGLLETYEKANQEFESVSDNHNSFPMYLVREQFSGKKDKNDIKDIIGDSLNFKTMSTTLSATPENVAIENVNNKMISQSPGLTNLTGSISNQAPYLWQTEFEKLEEISVASQNCEGNSSKVVLHLNEMHMDSTVNTLKKDVVSCKNSLYIHESENIQKLNNELIMESEPSNITCKNYEGSVKKELTTIPKNISHVYHSTPIKLKCLKSNHYNIEEIYKPSSVEKLTNENDNLENEINKEIKQTLSSAALQEVSSFTDKTFRQNKTAHYLTLLDGVVTNTKPMLFQIDSTTQHDSDDFIHENKALSEIKLTLKGEPQSNFRFLHIDKEVLCNDIPLTCCEAKRIKFKSVRKVSAHSILVKWSPPQDINDVRGYELLVDDMAVQKIFSPSQCIAVVTCIPQTDKIQLTIRTITYSVSDTQYYPSSTIIY